MAANKSQNTKPEMIARKYLWSLGFRYRINDKRLPGKPDIVLTRYKTVIFIHGCFWHGHEDCIYFRMPKTNVDFWTNKIERNRKRDIETREKLRQMGWRTMIIWECQLKKEIRQKTLEEMTNLLQKSYLDNIRIKRYDAISENEENMMVAEQESNYGQN